MPALTHQVRCQMHNTKKPAVLPDSRNTSAIIEVLTRMYKLQGSHVVAPQNSLRLGMRDGQWDDTGARLGTRRTRPVSVSPENISKSWSAHVQRLRPYHTVESGKPTRSSPVNNSSKPL